MVSYLLGIENEKQLFTHPLRGSLFENLIISETYKRSFNSIRNPNAYFYRDNKGNEVDLILQNSNYIVPIEIKSGTTFSRDMFKGINSFTKLDIKFKSPTLIYGGEDSFEYQDKKVVSYNNWSWFS